MIEQFYINKSILITGCTGFVGKYSLGFYNDVGKVLLEKVLRSLPIVKSIYVAIAPKVNTIIFIAYKQSPLTTTIKHLLKKHSFLKIGGRR